MKAAIDKVLRRGAYKKVECPHCGKMAGNLANHMKMAHPLEANYSETQEELKRELTKEDILTRKTPPPTEHPVYVCTGCKAEVRKGEAVCWNCQETLIWDGIE